MTQNHFVSVIIPTYNRAIFLVEAINSVLEQTYKKYEIIVIDDGSTDSTSEIIKQFGNKIRYFYQENGGPSAARNAGIKNAKGDLVAFIDSDDVWLPDKLSQQVQLFDENHRLGLVSSAYYSCDSNLNINRIIKDDRLTNKKYIMKKLFIRNIFPTPTVLVKRECFEKVGLFNESYGFAEDWEMWVRIVLEYDLAYIKTPLCRCRRHNSSITYQKQEENFNDWMKVIKENFKRGNERDSRIYHNVLLRKAMSWYYMNVSYHYSCKSDIGNEMKYLTKSLMEWPLLIDKKYILAALLSKLVGHKTYSRIKTLFNSIKVEL